MGTEDIRRQAPNVARMELLGAEVEPVDAGARTLKEAVSAAIRDWVATVGDTHYVIGSVVGPAPYPALVRDLQRVIGDEARAQALEAEGELPARVIACVGGGSNSIGTFYAFLDDPVELIGVEAAGEGLDSGRHGASLVGRLAPASSTAPSPRCSPTSRARSSRRTRSRPGSTTRASAPSTPTCATPAAPATSRSPTTDALLAFRELARLEGIIPALEPSHAIAWLLADERRRRRLRPALPLRPRRQGHGRGDGEARRARWLRRPPRPAQRIAEPSRPPATRAAPR